ncbi:phage antirepressor [Jeotgalibacillus terrae]|uniref:Phage antirepressor n=1 Tax=Jeotgalibacillus terrae TaxID=587735 RepID=A0ABW5ZIG7_9BACL|nr:phage antirepressor KilAC domain-containing protein [Jeotgalibacillus terrae]MBM7577696.1 anti-repressor protein [Jeotgalibacillus terrae]
MNQITKLFEDQRVRVMDRQGEPYFVLKDLCEILGLGQVAGVKRRLEKDVILNHPLQTAGGTQEAVFVNEDGLYDVILESRKPSAKRFRKWITSEVLPSIRKTGGYVSNEDMFIQTYLPHADEQTQLMFKSTLKTVREQNEKIAVLQPKGLFADAVSASNGSILIGDLAKLLKQNGFDTGQNRLFSLLRDQGYLIKKRGANFNSPTQKAMDLGLFRIKETAVTHSDGHVTINKTTKVTGKGQQYFINKFLQQSAIE